MPGDSQKGIPLSPKQNQACDFYQCLATFSTSAILVQRLCLTRPKPRAHQTSTDSNGCVPELRVLQFLRFLLAQCDELLQLLQPSQPGVPPSPARPVARVRRVGRRRKSSLLSVIAPGCGRSEPNRTQVVVWGVGRRHHVHCGNSWLREFHGRSPDSCLVRAKGMDPKASLVLMSY